MMIVKQNDKFLLTNKGDTEWKFPAGGREGNESVLHTLHREIEEELNLKEENFLREDITFAINEYEFNQEWKERRGCFGQRRFVAIVELLPGAKIKPDGHEIKNVMWLTKEEMMEQLTHEGQKETIKELEERGEL